MKGVARPKVYKIIIKTLLAGSLAAIPTIVPKIGPIQGVHPNAKENPSKNAPVFCIVISFQTVKI